MLHRPVLLSLSAIMLLAADPSDSWLRLDLEQGIPARNLLRRTNHRGDRVPQPVGLIDCCLLVHLTGGQPGDAWMQTLGGCDRVQASLDGDGAIAISATLPTYVIAGEGEAKERIQGLQDKVPPAAAPIDLPLAYAVGQDQYRGTAGQQALRGAVHRRQASADPVELFYGPQIAAVTATPETEDDFDLGRSIYVFASLQPPSSAIRTRALLGAWKLLQAPGRPYNENNLAGEVCFALVASLGTRADVAGFESLLCRGPQNGIMSWPAGAGPRIAQDKGRDDESRDDYPPASKGPTPGFDGLAMAELLDHLGVRQPPAIRDELAGIANAHREQVLLRLVEAAMHGQSRAIHADAAHSQLKELAMAWEVASAIKPPTEPAVPPERCRAAAGMLLRLGAASRPYLRVEGARLARAWLDHAGIPDGPERTAIAAALDGTPAADPAAMPVLIAAAGAAQAAGATRIDEFCRFFAGPRWSTFLPKQPRILIGARVALFDPRNSGSSYLNGGFLWFESIFADAAGTQSWVQMTKQSSPQHQACQEPAKPGDELMKKGIDMIELTAPPGYAVGAIWQWPGDMCHGLRLVYMRVTSTGLDARDSVLSDWVWNGGGDPDPSKRLRLGTGWDLIGGHGAPIVGYHKGNAFPTVRWVQALTR